MQSDAIIDYLYTWYPEGPRTWGVMDLKRGRSLLFCCFLCVLLLLVVDLSKESL